MSGYERYSRAASLGHPPFWSWLGARGRQLTRNCPAVGKSWWGVSGFARAEPGGDDHVHSGWCGLPFGLLTLPILVGGIRILRRFLIWQSSGDAVRVAAVFQKPLDDCG